MMGRHRIEQSTFIALDVAAGEYCYIVQQEGDDRDQITIDAAQAAQLADILAAWAHNHSDRATTTKDSSHDR